MPAIMMADPGRQGPGPGESKGVYGHFGSPADEHQREADHLRRMQVTYTLLCFFGWLTMKMTKTNGPKDHMITEKTQLVWIINSLPELDK